MMFKNIFKKLIISSFLLLGTLNMSFAEQPVIDESKIFIDVLEREECIHCQAQKKFFDELQQERDDLQIYYREIKTPKHKEMFDKITDLEGISKVTPITLINGQLIEGFAAGETTGRMYLDILNKAEPSENLSFEEFLENYDPSKVSKGGAGCSLDKGCSADGSGYQPFYIKVPFMESFDVKKYSLPVMSFILGAVDGFNPCAMWVLVTFILILSKIGDKKKLWQVIGLFLAAQAIMYAMILNLWMTVWDFVGLDAIITPIVGTIAIGAGTFFLWEFVQKDAGCKVTSSETKKKTKSKIEAIVSKDFGLMTALGIIGIALSINVIEFACSIGIPQVFTKILDLNYISFWGKQFYMSLYILAYMIDDLIVFMVALYSLDKLGLTTKYSKASNLIGGLLMLALGYILIFHRELLVFV